MMKRLQRLYTLLLLLLIGAGGCQPAFYPTGRSSQPTPEPAAILITGADLPQPALTPQPAAPITAPLFVNPDNRRYFTNGVQVNGKYQVVYLTGSHTWCNLIDCGSSNPPVVFDYVKFLDFLQARRYNFFRLWRTENGRGGEAGDNFWFNPMPYQRSNTCCAFDGGNKFDLTKFNQAYFDRMRARIISAGERGVYVSVMLFDGWSVESKFNGHNPWVGHPYRLENNINQIDGDINNNHQGEETHTLTGNQVTALQEAYVRKVVDTVNDLNNVLYEISNESPGDNPATAQADGSKNWQYHLINLIKNYEAGKPKQHPVGMTWEWPYGNNQVYYDSPADWISLGGNVDLNTYQPPVTSGAVNSKIILADTDHLCGICGSGDWVWKSFTRGENPIFMDIYDNATSGRGMPFNNPNEAEIRQNLTYAFDFAARMNLAAMTPQPALCSTGYCLANPAQTGAAYLVYLPAGNSVTMDLSGSPVTLAVEWFNPGNGQTIQLANITGGSTQSFAAPFSGRGVLYIFAVNSPAATFTPTRAATPTRTATPNPNFKPRNYMPIITYRQSQQ